MKEFNYNVSILIPVYNAQSTLDETVQSILAQVVEENFTYEVLLINDGSVDESEEVCLKYANEYPNIKYFKHENRGVSYTRNRGMDLAEGKYILFLDADDLITEDTLFQNYLLFEDNYDQADILAYPLYKYVNEQVLKHPRTDLYSNSGVYDVDAFPHINQTSMNTIIKNVEKKIYFDESMKFTEDTFFNIALIMKNRKIILSSKGAYLYRINSFSAVNLFKSPVKSKYLVDAYLHLIEKYKYNGEIPKYIQSVMLYEINWRMKSHGLYPRHLNKDEYREWEKKYLDVLSFISVEVIMSHIHVNEYHKYYFLNEKSDESAQVYLNEKTINYVSSGNLITSIDKLLLVFTKVKIKNNRILFEGFLKAPFLHELRNVSLIVFNGEKQLELPLNYSSYSYYQATEETNLFLGFEFDVDLTTTKLEFYVKINEKFYETTSYFQYNSILKEILPYVVYKDYVLSVDKTNSLQINIKKQPLKKWIYKAKLNIKIVESGHLLTALFKPLKLNLLKSLHLYNDSKGEFGPSFEAFKKAHKKNDSKIKPYYIYDEAIPIQAFSDLESSLYEYLVKKKSLKHKFLFLNATKVITSSVGFHAYSAYNEKAYIFLNELFSYDLYWLKKYSSRGISKKRYSREISGMDYVICEDKKDINILQNCYGYKPEQIIDASNDLVLRPKSKNKSILIAFSWRNELFESNLGSFENIKKSKFANSEYHQSLLKFLESKELLTLINKGYKVDLYLHPNFQHYVNLYNQISYEISILKSLKNIEQYDALITDFSSLEYEFMKNDKNVYHYLLDRNEFLCGNHYFKEVDYKNTKCYLSYQDLLIDLEKDNEGSHE